LGRAVSYCSGQTLKTLAFFCDILGPRNVPGVFLEAGRAFSPLDLPVGTSNVVLSTVNTL